MTDIFSKNVINLKDNEYKMLFKIADNEFVILTESLIFNFF